jgi:hypothetical protein
LIPEVLAVNRYHIQLSIKREMVKRSEQGPTPLSKFHGNHSFQVLQPANAGTPLSNFKETY